MNGSGSYVQTLIVLDEMTPDSGPLMFVPGSSQWGRMKLGGGGYDDSSLAVDSQPEWVADAVTIAARPGDTLFFGPYTVHGSFENNSTHYRRVLINGFAAPGANQRVYPGSGTGQRLEVAGPAATQPA